MPRPATGQEVELERESGTTFALRFRAYGNREYVTLGTKAQGWNRTKAETELRHVLADVERGIWTPAAPEPVDTPTETPGSMPLQANGSQAGKPSYGLRRFRITDGRWNSTRSLSSKITRWQRSPWRRVDRYRTAKLR